MHSPVHNEIICAIKIRANTLLLVQPKKSLREIESFGGKERRIHSLILYYEDMGAINVLEISVHLLARMLPVHTDYYY